MQRLVKVWSTLVVSCGLAMSSAPSHGQAPSNAIEAELGARLAHAYGPTWASGDAAKFVDEFLTQDCVLTAEGSDAAWQGRQQAIELLKDLIKDFKTVTPRAVVTRQVGPDAAFQFVEFAIIARNPADQARLGKAKSLYVWKKTAHGWRVTADLYAFSGITLK